MGAGALTLANVVSASASVTRGLVVARWLGPDRPAGDAGSRLGPARPPPSPVTFLSSGRQSHPLDPSTSRKFALLAARRDIWVIGFAAGLFPGGFIQHARFLLLPWVPIRLVRRGVLAAGGTLLAVWCAARHRAGILVAPSPQEALIAVTAKAVARWLGHRVIVVVESHGDFEAAPLLYRRGWWPSLGRRASRAAARVSLERADLLRAVSDSTRRQLSAWAPGRPVVQFPAWTDLEPFFAAPAAAEPGADVAFAGVLAPIKGIHVLLDALALVNRRRAPTTLSIMGPRLNRAYAAALRRQTEQLALDPVVRFLGPLPVPTLVHHLASARLLVLPSLSEGLPRVLLEAMAAGRPVVASRVGGIPEIVRDGVTGFLVPPGDDGALADRILWLVEHPQEASAMGVRGRAFARDFFSADRYAEGYADLFAAADRLLEPGQA
jgi:glycosyltransferase involved in cell wall biosynthesis